MLDDKQKYAIPFSKNSKEGVGGINRDLNLRLRRTKIFTIPVIVKTSMKNVEQVRECRSEGQLVRIGRSYSERSM